MNSNPQSLKQTTLRGFFWTFTDIFFLKGASFIASLILARILGPEEFGLIGMINIFIVLAGTLIDSGLSSSLIRTKIIGKKDFSTVFYTNLALSLLLYISIYILSPYVALFYNKPVLTSVIRVYCSTFIISSFSIIQITILTKQLKFRKLMILNVPGTIIGVLIGVLMGYMGYGVWSIVWMYVSTQIVQSTVLWIFSEWKPALIFSLQRLKVHFNFGYKLMLSGILDTAFSNIYNIIIGKFYNAKMLGLYERSFLFNQYPVSVLSGIINKVTYPILSNLQKNQKQISEVYKQILQLTFFISAPLMLGLAAVAKPLFLLILGEKWIQAVPFFQIISLGSIFYPIHVFNINVLKVYGKSDLFLRLEVIKKILGSVGIAIGFAFGIYGLVWSGVVTSLLALIVNTYYSSQFINYTTRQQLLDMVPTLILSSITFIVILIISNILLETNLTAAVLLPSLAGLITYIGLNFLFKTRPISFLHTILNNKMQ